MHIKTTADKARLAEADARFKSEFAEARAYFERRGTSEADYISSRRIDEGLAVLAHGAGDEADETENV